MSAVLWFIAGMNFALFTKELPEWHWISISAWILPLVGGFVVKD